jgi:hypothetical protein
MARPGKLPDDLVQEPVTAKPFWNWMTPAQEIKSHHLRAWVVVQKTLCKNGRLMRYLGY